MQSKVFISYVDKNLCEACESCVKVCKQDCFAMVEKEGKIISNFQNKDKCDECGECLHVCPNNAIILEIEGNKNKNDQYVVINPEKCEGCESCVKICPEGFEIIENEKGVHSHKKDCSCKKNLRCVFLCKNHALDTKDKI